MGCYANPVGVLALLLLFLKKRTVAVIVGVIAVAIAFSVLNDIGRQLPGDEGGVTHTYIARVLPGFYIWMRALLQSRCWPWSP